MISYKIITRELYDNLQKLSSDFTSQKHHLIQAKNQLIQKVNQIQQENTSLKIEIQQRNQQNLILKEELNKLQIKQRQISQKLIIQKNNSITLNQQNIETTNQFNKLLIDYHHVLNDNSQLIKKLQILENALILLNQKNQQVLMTKSILQSQNSKFNQLVQSLKKEIQRLNCQKQNALVNYSQKINQKTTLIEQIISQYQTCKEEKTILQIQVKKFKESPIPVLEEKLKAKQAWIQQLTKNINQLNQKCVQLQMNPHNSQIPQIIYRYKSTNPSSIINKKSQDNERTKYLTICKQIVKKVHKKLSKIQQQKKQAQQRYQSIKLKLNQYQYNEFRYKDKLSLYWQKIQKYQKLTLKQQQQMQKIIHDFDEQINHIIKIKQEEVKTKEEEAKYKLQEEILKYKLQLQKLKQEEQSFKRLLNEQQKEQQKSQNSQGKQESIDNFEFQMIKQGLEHAQKQILQKQAQIQRLKKQLSKSNKQLNKYKESKKYYKDKYLHLQEQCYNNSVEIRRYKILVQELCQQLEIKNNEYQILKTNLINISEIHKNQTHRSYYNSEEIKSNLNSKVTQKNYISLGKNSSTDRFQYQVSQIDTQLQKRNQVLLNAILINNNQSKGYNMNSPNNYNNPAGPSRISYHSDENQSIRYLSNAFNSQFKIPIGSMNKSRASQSSQSQNDTSRQGSIISNSPTSSNSSKNSYQSYGIKYLYKDKQSSQNFSNKFLFHKNSLQ